MARSRQRLGRVDGMTAFPGSSFGQGDSPAAKIRGDGSLDEYLALQAPSDSLGSVPGTGDCSLEDRSKSKAVSKKTRDPVSVSAEKSKCVRAGGLQISAS